MEVNGKEYAAFTHKVARVMRVALTGYVPGFEARRIIAERSGLTVPRAGEALNAAVCAGAVIKVGKTNNWSYRWDPNFRIPGEEPIPVDLWSSSGPACLVSHLGVVCHV